MIKTQYLKKLMVAPVVISGAMATAASGVNADDHNFFSDENVEILIPFSAGGGTDTLFRYMQSYMSEHTPGNPTFQILNVPGGGSVLGANEYVILKEPNGYNTLATSASTTIPFMIGQESVEYDLRDMQPIIGVPNGVVMYTSPDSGIEEATDLQNPSEELFLGATSPTGIDVMTLLALEVLDIKDNIEIIFGYEGAGASRTAFMQGETNLDYQSGSSYQNNVTPLVEEGSAVPLFSYGFLGEDGDIVRDPAFPEIPSVKEVYVDMHGGEPSGEAWDAYKVFVGVVNGLHKTLWLHADAPSEAAEDLREGAIATINDEAFIEGGADVLGGYTPLVGSELEAAINALAEVDESTLEWVRTYLEEEYDVTGLK